MAVSDDVSHFATLFQRGDSSLDTFFNGLHLAAHNFFAAVDQDQQGNAAHSAEFSGTSAG